MTLNEKINTEFKNWINATNDRQSNKHLNMLIIYLKKITESYIDRNYKDLDEFSEDIFQDIYIKIHDKIDKINAKDYFSAWFYKVLKNKLIDVIRHLNTNKISKIKSEDEYSGEDTFEEMEENYCYNEYLIENQDNIDYEVICDLIENDKENKLLHDKYAQGYSNPELAERYNTSIDGIKSRIGRAKNRIKDKYKKSIELS